MSDHLPECPWPDEPCGHEPMHDRQPVFCVACLTECICDRLRACEQRVLEEERALVAVERTTLAELNAEYRKGVQAARDAWVALPKGTVGDLIALPMRMDEALAAIYWLEKP